MSGAPPVVTVRRATVDDAEGVRATMAAPRAMAGTLQVPLPSVEMWRKRIAEISPDDYLLVAEVEGEVVGNLGLHSAGRSPRRRHVGLVGMAVRDDWQGKGVGAALLAAALDIADNWLNYRRLELTVYTDNDAAHALYRKFGFEVEGLHRDFAFRDGRFVDVHAMARLRPAAVAPLRGRTDTQPASVPKASGRKATKTARKR
jgi:L-phenylalanine/L-methionine N-acetyltransferase